MERKRELVKGANTTGQEIEVAVVRPGNKVSQEAQLEFNRKIASLIREGQKGERLLLRSELDKHLEQLGVWTREDANKYVRVQAEINTCVLALRRGGMKLSEGRSLALHVGDLRNQLLELYGKRSQLDGTTIEAVAENHKFDWLVTQCLLRADTGGPYFADLADYIARKDEPVVMLAAAKLAQMLYGYDTSYIDKLPENQWLKEFGFVNGDGRLTNRKGQLTDRDGRRVNEQGQYIDDQGNVVDHDGNRVDADGKVVVETQPFVDDETGEPVPVTSQPPVAGAAPAPKRKKRRV